MRFHSTPQSVLNGEITKLAIIECVVAVALYVGIGVYFHTFRHLAVPVAVAPLMLFRTKASVRWGLDKYAHAVRVVKLRYHPYLLAVATLTRRSNHRKVITIALIPGYVFIFGAVAVSGAVIRVAATMYWTLRKPLYTLGSMPQNWVRQGFCTDLFYPPEILPLEAVYGNQYEAVETFATLFREKEINPLSEGELRRLKAAEMNPELSLEELELFIQEQKLRLLKAIDDRTRSIEKHYHTVLLLLFTIFGYLPSIFYRISFKATSLIYSPFTWVALVTLPSPLSVKLGLNPPEFVEVRLKRIKDGEMEKTGRALSLLLLGLLAAKLGLAFWLGRF